MDSRLFVPVVSLVAIPLALGGVACRSSTGGGVGTPACTAEAPDGGLVLPAYGTPAYGSFAGPELSGNLCVGGAVAYLERTSSSRTTSGQLVLIINTFSANTFHVTDPADATGAGLSILAGVSAATPGTYPSNASCGSIAFCVDLPVPSWVECGDAAAPTTCPPGCSLFGPVSGPTCTPTTPEDCYVSQAVNDCAYGTQSPTGSWTVTLTSVQPYDAEGSDSDADYVVHGTFLASMIAAGDDAGPRTASLSLSF
jgi:hypothetical protein